MLIPSINNNLKTVLAQSQGEYKSRDKTVTTIFENTVTNIPSFMFFQLLGCGRKVHFSLNFMIT